MPNKNRRGNWVGCQRLAGLAVVAVAVDANGAGLAVELAVELAVALGARSLVGVMVKKKRHRFVFGKGWTPFTPSPRCVGITFTV